MNTRRYRASKHKVYRIGETILKSGRGGTSMCVTTRDDGSLCIERNMFGDDVEEHYGDFDLETYVTLDKENTHKLKLAVGRNTNDGLVEQLKIRFLQKLSLDSFERYCEKMLLLITHQFTNYGLKTSLYL